MQRQLFNILSSMFLSALLAVSCNDDDYKNITKNGEPTANAEGITTAVMGSQLSFSVNCSDNSGIELSTLKAELLFSGEVVDQTIQRTAENGNYQVSLNVPFLRYIPDGEAIVRLSLTNVTTKVGVNDIKVNVERPHFDNLQFVSADGNKVAMSEVSPHLYSGKFTTSETAFKGHFETADGEWIFGTDGTEITLGGSGNLAFQCENPGEIVVTFNTCTYSYSPNDEIAIAPLLFSEDDNIITRQMVKGRQYFISGNVANDWFVDGDFFENDGDGVYTFLAENGTYTLTAYSNYKYLQIYPGTHDAPSTLQKDGTGAIWVIGGTGINKPSLTASNNQDWWTNIEYVQSLAQIEPKVYRITLTVGEQLSATSVNFKFFGQAGWGIEFKGLGGEYNLSCESETFGIGDGNNGHDNGNIFLKDGATLTEGDTYTFTIDLTEGVDKGKLIVKKGAAAKNIDLVDKEAVVSTLKKGTTYAFGGDATNDMIVDHDFFKDNGDDTYTFLCINGDYAIKAYTSYNYIQVYPVDKEGKAATLQKDGTGAIWIIGSDCINKPLLTSSNNQGWNTDIQSTQCLAPISDKIYRITLTVGEQLSATGVNFKFFGQSGWGIEFNGLGGDYHLDINDNDDFRINAAESDNGNIFLNDGATLNEGDTFTFTIDLTEGVANGKLTIEKQ